MCLKSLPLSLSFHAVVFSFDYGITFSLAIAFVAFVAFVLPPSSSLLRPPSFVLPPSSSLLRPPSSVFPTFLCLLRRSPFSFCRCLFCRSPFCPRSRCLFHHNACSFRPHLCLRLPTDSFVARLPSSSFSPFYQRRLLPHFILAIVFGHLCCLPTFFTRRLFFVVAASFNRLLPRRFPPSKQRRQCPTLRNCKYKTTKKSTKSNERQTKSDV